jgi:hypothetical protein
MEITQSLSFMILALLFWFWGLVSLWLLTGFVLAARLNREAMETQAESR